MHPVITRKLEFDAGHRVLGHGGKCRHIHGHRYVAEVSVRARDLNDLGMVVDFSKVKEVVGGWIDRWWDHNLILHPKDPLWQVWGSEYEQFEASRPEEAVNMVFGGRRPYMLDLPPDMPDKFGNPTAENMARVLFNVADILLTQANAGVEVVGVRIYETPNCWADYPCSR